MKVRIYKLIHSIHTYMFLNNNNFYSIINYLNQTNSHLWTKLFFNGNLRIKLTNRNGFKYLFLSITDIGDMLEKQNVDDSDHELVHSKLDELLKPMFKSTFKAVEQLKVKSVDYKLNIKTTPIEKVEYMGVALKSRDTFSTARKKIHKDNGILTGIEFTNKTAKVIFYDKDKEMVAHPDKFRDYLQDMLRIEVRLYKPAIVKNKRNGIDNTLFNYFSSEMRYKAFNDYLIGRFIFKGDFFDYKTVKKHLKSSSLEKKIKSMLQELAENDVDYILGTYAAATLKKYMSHLESLNINAVTLNELQHLKGIDSLVKPIEVEVLETEPVN